MPLNLNSRKDYDADAIHALVQFNPKFTFEAWETEVETIIEEEGCGFKEAVYIALVDNYNDK